MVACKAKWHVYAAVERLFPADETHGKDTGLAITGKESYSRSFTTTTF